MKFLPCPQVDVPHYVAQLVEERQNGSNASFFSEISEEWVTRCEAYHTWHGDAANITPWAKANGRSNSFINLYRNPKEGVQGGHIRALRGHDLLFCPVCGEAGTPYTLDHYLPKEHFPHFAVLPQNLIPCCDICQGKKKSEYQGQQGRLFAHLYYDDFLIDQAVRLQIGQPYNSPKASLIWHPDLPEEFHSLVQRHIVGVGLEKRFYRFFRTEYRRILRQAASCRKKAVAVSAFLEINRETAAEKSVSSWEHILLEGVLANHAVLDYLQNGDLPPFL
ncbi:hypothetical protein [Agrobacterium burrii]|uniref:HNH endonuclease n=1 Tax=Agrobacterium burrii TaxID=2815339 RepID=A0ABS3ERI9_9HYPH|nr:hypothetical protein [Agrobacterium burrii]MBO0134632.1 hypothetical protein [Agrobacterium burrii]